MTSQSLAVKLISSVITFSSEVQALRNACWYVFPRYDKNQTFGATVELQGKEESLLLPRSQDLKYIPMMSRFHTMECAF